MRDRLRAVVDESDRLAEEMANPDIALDPQKYMKLARRHAEMSELVASLHQYERTELALAEAEAVLGQEDDPEMVAMATEERDRARAILLELETSLRLLLVPKDPLDEKNTIVEIRAGTGGEEASLRFVLATMFLSMTRFSSLCASQ